MQLAIGLADDFASRPLGSLMVDAEMNGGRYGVVSRMRS
jgi:hypothetical protein